MTLLRRFSASSASAWMVVAGVSLLVVGCGNSPPRESAHRARPAAFMPEDFPDIPLPHGYIFMLNVDQLAVSYAGGMVRRFEVSLERRGNVKPQSPSELLEQVGSDLSEQHWNLVTHNGNSQSWHKGEEDLLVDTGRNDSLTTIRYRLRPSSSPGTPPAEQ